MAQAFDLRRRFSYSHGYIGASVPHADMRGWQGQGTVRYALGPAPAPDGLGEASGLLNAQSRTVHGES